MLDLLVVLVFHNIRDILGTLEPHQDLILIDG